MLRLVFAPRHIEAKLAQPLDCVPLPLWCTQGEFSEVTSEQMATAEAGQGLRGVHVDACDPNIVNFKFFYRGTRKKKVRAKSRASHRSDGPSTHTCITSCTSQRSSFTVIGRRCGGLKRWRCW